MKNLIKISEIADAITKNHPNLTDQEPEQAGDIGKALFKKVRSVINRKKEEEEEPYRRALSLMPASGMKKGGKVSASKRADGICKRGKTKGRMI